MKHEAMVKMFSNIYNIGVILSYGDSTGQTPEQVAEFGIEGAMNDNPNITEPAELADLAIQMIKSMS